MLSISYTDGGTCVADARGRRHISPSGSLSKPMIAADRAYVAGLLFAGFRRRFRAQWLAYVPLAFYLCWLMLRHRSATLFTAANPGIATGGTTGESKSSILEKLGRIEGAVAGFAVVRADQDAAARIRAARQWIKRCRVTFPVVLKPDVGQRGLGVAVVRGHDEMVRYLLRTHEATIVQRFVEGVEFGIFYRRMPGEPRGHIVSIAETRHPIVVGDGRATLGALLREGPWVAARAASRGMFNAGRLCTVPFEGERVHLFEIGFCSHNATFVDRSDLCTPMLEETIETISRAHPGFFFGRFDVCAASAADLERGRFQVIELNGVLAEPTHIYDPATSIAEAFRVLRRQWRDAFEIGAANRAQGVRPTPSMALLRLLLAKVHGPSRGRREFAGSNLDHEASARMTGVKRHPVLRVKATPQGRQHIAISAGGGTLASLQVGMTPEADMTPGSNAI